MRYTTTRFALTRFVAKIKDWNGPSVALFERLGFHRVKHSEVFQEFVYERAAQNGAPA